jgi:CHAT domain-containing protein
MLIVPDGRLHQLPFELLERDGLLDDRYTVAYVPSLTTLRVMDELPRAQAPAAELFALGDPAYAGDPASAAPERFLDAGVALTPLPGSGEEVRAIARTLGQAPAPEATLEQWARHGVFMRELATESALRRHMPSARFVHIATHTVIDDADPSYAGLALAPPAEPEIAADPSLDDLLLVPEVLAMRLAADVVVCSACRTGHGRLHDGEGLVGFSRAFLLAGASCVVVSLWPVDDTMTAALMQRFYRHLQAEVGPADALRRARGDIRTASGGQCDARDWAAFIAIGDAS